MKRNYLEINSLQDLIEGNKPSEDYSLSLIDPINFQLNKFFYKNIGKNHHWVDRLVWTEKQWIDYVSDKNVETYVLKNEKDFGYLAYQNFDNILKWNRSNYFAIAVGSLSDHILYGK